MMLAEASHSLCYTKSMKKRLSLFVDILILISVWVLCLVTLGYLMVIMMYFTELNILAFIASFSALLLAIAYTIFWVKRFKKSRVK